jgi:predicted amidohydrolase
MSKSPKTLKVACAQMHWAKSLDYNVQKSLDFMKVAVEADAIAEAFLKVEHAMCKD